MHTLRFAVWVLYKCYMIYSLYLFQYYRTKLSIIWPTFYVATFSVAFSTYLNTLFLQFQMLD